MYESVHLLLRRPCRHAPTAGASSVHVYVHYACGCVCVRSDDVSSQEALDYHEALANNIIQELLHRARLKADQLTSRSTAERDADAAAAHTLTSSESVAEVSKTNKVNIQLEGVTLPCGGAHCVLGIVYRRCSLNVHGVQFI